MECLHYTSTGQVGWHGSTSEVYRTKTGKLLCSLTEWSCVDGESDHQTNILADDPAYLLSKLSELNGTAAEQVRAFLAEKTDCLLTV